MIEFSQGFSPNTEKLFDEWFEAKREVIEWFGGKLIYEIGSVELHVDNNKRDNMIHAFIDQCAQFIAYSEFSNFYQFIKMNQETFFKNVVSNDTITFDQPIKKGMKLSKAFKYFIKDKETLIRVQQLASSYIQKDKIHGTLCLSVHPLDFISASETTYNWRSCHALDGEYRAGNLSYMTDTATICCYIKGDEDVILPHFPGTIPWNSKKWRMWIHLDEHWQYCFLGRQYPFTLDGITERLECLLPGQWNTFTDYSIESFIDPNTNKTTCLTGVYVALNSFCGMQLFNIYQIVKEKSRLNYNDVLRSSCYDPYYSSKRNIQSRDNPLVEIGHDVKCLACGEHDIPVGEGLMTCLDCAEKLGLLNGYVECEDCGQLHHPDDLIYLHDGTAICEDCINNGGYYCCDHCGEWFREDEMQYSECYETWYCISCFDSKIFDDEMDYRRQQEIERGEKEDG